MTAIALGILTAVSVVVGLCRWPQRRQTYVRSWRPTPGLWLLVIAAVAVIDQVLVSIYVLRVHHGDAGFIVAYVGPAWFHIERSPMLVWIAEHVPTPPLLSASVLRVPSFYELPFGIFAYLTVARWFGVEGAARRLVWPASISFTVAFCLIEWHIPTPYTVQDIAIRAVSAVVLPFWVSRLTAPPAPRAVLGPVGLLGATIASAALGWLVLAAYETVLLYNLGDLRFHLPGVVAAGVVLLAARVVVAHLPDRPPGIGIDAVGSAFGEFLVLFFVPALAIRYGIGFGAAYVSAAAAVVLAVVALLRTGKRLKARHRYARAWQTLMAATLAGGATAVVTALLTSGYAEMRLLWGAAVGLLLTIALCIIGDLIRRPGAT
ncbi:MAG: hypothetical protein J2O46_08505, partial [Nocardioides sp.]|nr:hypothetical protein [Nocardioides sp.]